MIPTGTLSRAPENSKGQGKELKNIRLLLVVFIQTNKQANKPAHQRLSCFILHLHGMQVKSDLDPVCLWENTPCTPIDWHKGENNIPTDMKQESWGFFENENDKSGLMIRQILSMKKE